METLNMTPYCGDDYDRTGCRAVVDVVSTGYRLSIFAPNGAPMEVYATAKSAGAISRMLKEWLDGKVPCLHRPEDQLSESKS